MYLVPTEIPKNCNKCPFGMCNYNLPSWGVRIGEKSISSIDGEENPIGTYGYACNIDFQRNGRYTKVLRADIGNDITKPEWCELKDI